MKEKPRDYDLLRKRRLNKKKLFEKFRVPLLAVMILFFSFSIVEAAGWESPWFYFLGKDELTGSPDYRREFVTKTKTVSHSDGQREDVALAYYCQYGSVVLLSRDRALKKDYPIRLKFDGRPVITKFPILTEDRAGGWNRHADLGHADLGTDWKKLLKEHYRLRIEFTPSYGLPIVAEFNLIGFSAEIAKCKSSF